MRITLPVTSVLILLLAACAGTDESGYMVESEDGVRVLRYASHSPPGLDPYALEPGTVYGADQGASTYLLENLTWEMAVGREGRLFIYDVQARTIHRFTVDGSYDGKIGREGEGPGEFRTVIGLTALGDSLIVFDPRMRRVSIFADDGLLRNEIRSDAFQQLYSLKVNVRGDSQALIGYRSHSSVVSGGEDTYRYSILHFDSDGGSVHTVIDSTDRRSTAERGVTGNPVEARIANWAMGPNTPVAWIQGPEYRIEFYDPADGGRWRVESPGRRRPVTSEIRTAFYERERPERDRERERRTTEWPEVLPEIGNVLWDDEGRLWVWVYEPHFVAVDRYLFDVYSESGEFLFAQHLEPTHPLLIARGHVYVLDNAPDGSEIVRTHRLVGRQQQP